MLRVRFHFLRALSRFEHIAATASNAQILILLVPSGFVQVFGARLDGVGVVTAHFYKTDSLLFRTGVYDDQVAALSD